MANGDVYYAKWKFENTGSGKVMTPGIYVRQVGPTWLPDGVATNMIDFWNVTHGITNGLKAWYNATTQLDAILIRRVNPMEPVEYQYSTGLPITGTDVADELDLQIAIDASWRTGQIGKSYRGRTYFPNPTEAHNPASGSALSSTDATNLKAQLDWLRGRLNGVTTTAQIVVYSRKLGTNADVTLVKVDRRFRTQRRRQIKGALFV